MEIQYINIKDVCKKTSLSSVTVWRKEKAGEFPKRIQLSRNRVAWIDSEVNRWSECTKQGIPYSAI